MSLTKIISLLLVLCGLHFSCKKEEVTVPCILEDVQTPFIPTCHLTRDLDSVKLLIHNTWSWLQEERPTVIGTRYLTPKSEGHSESIKLFSDTVRFYQCEKMNGEYTYKIVRWTEISGTNFPEDQYPVLVCFELSTGKKVFQVPVKICNDFLVLQYQYVSSSAGQVTLKRI